MVRALCRRAGWLTVFAAAALAAPLAAQFYSEGYEFLKAVKDRDGDTATQALNEPGTVVVNARDITSGETALHIVTQRRDGLWIKFLTQKGANPNIADKNGVTPLVLAANLGFIEGVESLLKAGAQVDVSNTAGETPLIGAVHRRDVAMVRILLANGANPDRADNSGRTARDYARLSSGGKLILTEMEAADEKRKAGGEKAYGPNF